MFGQPFTEQGEGFVAFSTEHGIVQKEKETTEDEMVGQHHQPDGHEFEQAPGDSDDQGNLACCSPWGCRESDTTNGLNYDDVEALY